MSGLSSRVSSSMKGITAVVAAAAAAIASLGIGSAVQDAMKVEAMAGQLGRTMGSNAKEFEQWAKTTAASFGLARTEAIQFGALYSQMISDFSKSTKETMQSTQNVLKAAAIISQSTGRDMADVADRIRSAFNQEADAADELGINVRVAALESSDAFKKLANGKQWADLSQSTQRQIILTQLLSETSRRYGDTLQNNTMRRHLEFTAQLKNAKTALGEAFLPIYNAVLPALTKMANYLVTASTAIAGFTQALFGGGTKGAQQQTEVVKSLGSAYEDAGEKASRSVASFDEINQLSESSGGGSAASSSESKSSEAEADVAQSQDAAGRFTKMAEKFKKAIAPLIDGFRDVGDQAKKLWDVIKNLVPWDELLDKLGEITIIRWAGALKVDEGILQSLRGVLEILKGIVTMDFKTWWEGVKNVWAGMGKIIIGLFQNLTGIDVEKAFDEFKKMLAEKWADIKADVESLFPGITKAVKEGWEELTNWESWSKVVEKISQGWKDIKDGIGGAWSGIRKALSEAWNKLFDGTEITWDEVKTTVAKLWTDIDAAVSPAWTKIRNGVNEAWQGFTDGKNIVWESVKTAVEGVWEAIKTGAVIKWVEIRTAVKEVWDSFTNGSVIAWKSVENIVSGAWEDIKKISAVKWIEIRTAVKDIWSTFTDGNTILWDSVETKVSEIWGSVKEETDLVWEGMKQTVKEAVNWIIDKIDNFIDAYNSIEISIPVIDLPLVGKVGGGTIGVPQIPRIPKLARGGLATGPTLAMVGDNPGAMNDPEVISPLSKLQAMLDVRDESMADSIASAIGSAVMTAMQTGGQSRSGQQGDIVLQIDGVAFARLMNAYNANESKRIGGSMMTIT